LDDDLDIQLSLNSDNINDSLPEVDEDELND